MFGILKKSQLSMVN